MSRRRKKREGQVENLAFCYLLSVSDIGELQPSGSMLTTYALTTMFASVVLSVGEAGDNQGNTSWAL